MTADASKELPPSADTRHRRVVAGFVAGVVLVSALGFFAAYWHGRTSTPGGASSNDTSTDDAVLGANEAHGTTGALPAEAAALAASLESRLLENAGDVASRRELAVLLLRNELWVPAFDHARELRRVDPEDPDGLYVEGVVRLRMGHNHQGVELLDRLLATHPDHVEGWLAKGLGLLRAGDSESAIATWQHGLDAVGGVHPELERMLAISRAAIDEKARAGVARQVSSFAADAETTTASIDTPAGGGFEVTVDLTPGTAAPERATLFVSIVGAPGSPPALVKRISSPRFPLVARLTAADVMLGGELPRAGTIRARLDRDGNATTREEGDLEGSTAGEIGQAASISLRRRDTPPQAAGTPG